MKLGITSATTGVLAATVIGLVLSAGSSLSPILAGAAVSAAGTGCPALGNTKNNSGCSSSAHVARGGSRTNQSPDH